MTREILLPLAQAGTVVANPGASGQDLTGFAAFLFVADAYFNPTVASASLPILEAQGLLFASGTLVVGPVVMSAGYTVEPMYYVHGTDNPSEWEVSWILQVANAAATEVLHAFVQLTDTLGGTQIAPPTADWTVFNSVGTDLTMADNFGTAVVTTTAGGIFWVTLNLQFSKLLE